MFVKRGSDELVYRLITHVSHFHLKLMVIQDNKASNILPGSCCNYEIASRLIYRGPKLPTKGVS